MTKSFGDIDIDLPDRTDALNLIPHIAASIIDGDMISSHNTGIYIQNIPKDPVTGLSSLDYRVAEELGYVKIDLLNLNVYQDIKDESHLQRLLESEPLWDLLEHREIVEQLAHIHGHFDIVSKLQPKSLDQLAMVLAIIRPAKRYLLNKTWTEIEKSVWTKPASDEYYFKRAHAISYAMVIVMQMNLLIEEPKIDS